MEDFLDLLIATQMIVCGGRWYAATAIRNPSVSSLVDKGLDDGEMRDGLFWPTSLGCACSVVSFR